MPTKVYDILIKLLEPIDEMEYFREDPDIIADQFVRWINHVKSALEAANLNNELVIWNEACSRIKFSPYETSQTVHMDSMKAILKGFIYKYSSDEIGEELFDLRIFEGTPNYILRIATEASGCYERGWHDASLVMIRRLIESLIIDCFENYTIQSKIKKADENYFQLSELLTCFLAEESWSVSRGTKSILPRLKELKDLGDQAAHNRRFLATKRDIEKFSKEMRICFQEIVSISQSKRIKQ